MSLKTPLWEPCGFLSGCRQWHCWAFVHCEFSLCTQCSVWCLQGSDKCLEVSGETAKATGGNIALDIFYPKYENRAVLNESLLIWQEPQWGNLAAIMTQTICTHPPVQPAIHLEILPAEQIPVIHGGSAAGMLSRQVFGRFSCIFQLLRLRRPALSPA